MFSSDCVDAADRADLRGWLVGVLTRRYNNFRGCVDLRRETFTLSALSDEHLTDWVKSDLLETNIPSASPLMLPSLPIGLNRTYWKQLSVLCFPLGFRKTLTDWVKSDLLETFLVQLESILKFPLPIGLNRTYWKQELD